MSKFKVGDKVAAPVCTIFPNKKLTRSKCGYDIGRVIATGRNKRTGNPAVKVSIPVPESVWAKRITDDPVLEKWVLSADCDKM